MSLDKRASDEYLKKVRQYTKESITFLANENKPERERCVVRAFLRCLGISFTEKDLLVGQPEPVDVAALGGRLQVTEVLFEDRRPHQEYKKLLENLNQLTSDEELWGPWENPRPVSWGEVVRRVRDRLRQKTAHPDIDALVYINLGQTFVNVDSARPDFWDVAVLGWRSVSAVYLPYAIVMHAGENAPAFLRNAVGPPRNAWMKLDGWFEPDA